MLLESQNCRHITPSVWPERMRRLYLFRLQFRSIISRSLYTSFHGRCTLAGIETSFGLVCESDDVEAISPLDNCGADGLLVRCRFVVTRSEDASGVPGDANIVVCDSQVSSEPQVLRSGALAYDAICKGADELSVVSGRFRRLVLAVRLLTSDGRPHPHFVHFLSICCSHMRCQTASSSAKDFQVLLTCAA